MTYPITSTIEPETTSNPGARSSGATSVAKPAATAGCCGGPSKSDATACCVADETAKASGKSGCGCGTKPAVAGEKPTCGG